MAKCLDCGNTSSFFANIKENTDQVLILNEQISYDDTTSQVHLKYTNCAKCNSTNIQAFSSECYFETINENDLEYDVEPIEDYEKLSKDDSLKDLPLEENVIRFEI